MQCDQDGQSETLRQRRFSKLLALARRQRQPSQPIRQEDGPAWLRLDQYHCHICHRRISSLDEASQRLRIGSSACRPRIEREEQCGEEMWQDISEEKLWALWTKYNLHGVRFSGVSTVLKTFTKSAISRVRSSAL